MSVYESEKIDKMIAVDVSHAYMLTALVAARKPQKILELGFGAGASCRAILEGLNFNIQPYSFTLADNWLDFGGVPPSETSEEQYKNINFITSAEKEFVFECIEKFDFIFSDADHQHTQEWFEHVYNNLLRKEGILIYHDVTCTQFFPNLMQIYADVVRKDIHHMLFNYNSRPDERCDRGLLVIFKH